MGGLIKVSIKENNKVVTAILHTAFFSGRYSAINDLYKNITQKELIKDAEFFDDEEVEDLEPTNYGHLFIDRDNKNIFNLNDFCDIGSMFFTLVRNRMEEYKDDKEPEKGREDPYFQHTNNAFLYNLKNSIESSDSIYYNIYKNKEEVILKECIERDPLLLVQDFLNFYDKEGEVLLYIKFHNKSWTIKNREVNEDNILEFKEFLKNINLSY